MDLSPVVARIAAQCPQFKLVGGAAEFGSVEGVPPAMPACFVIPLADQADNDMQGATFIVQTVNVSFGVLFAVGNVKSLGGGEALVDLETLRAAVRASLLGWTPPNATAACRFGSGELVSFQPGLMWWQDGFNTAHHIQSL